ncbi:nucleolar protein [Cryptococcus gattii E566]|uniref:Nucleolar protein, putative n=1 Tax=Cryptococcus gattii serotype B (strain WM276 / ATCC MYA-4071) TaxID=367775 RepID=E6R4K4_CRYGW|nr:Nucleolar protein, putative [Cryptococcus gattii WM276]ADV22000.1 Nucleolar protein, putative [Cryptococcus gattii WM276]KIY33456.1 nucleolar protein [Cryptococcus gattii E566]KJE00413.1 nucleolar protein [Cryptococcus gattii NT-10]
MASSLQETAPHQPVALPVSPGNIQKEKKARKRAKKDQPPSEGVLSTESKPDAESERPPRKPRARKSKGGENQLTPVSKSNASAPETKVENEAETKDKKKRRKRESRAGTEAETKESLTEDARVDAPAINDKENDDGKVQEEGKGKENGAEKVEKREKTSDEASKEGKKRKRKAEQPHVEPQTTTAEVSASPVAATTAEGNDEPKEKKPKREKRPKIKSVKGAVDISKQPEVDVQVAPEGSESTTIFTDSSLSDQAKKNIFYAHLFALSQSPSPAPNTPSWKFSKAKQNWLMRNIFNHIEVPETYFEVVLGYLKTTQGHSRNTLVEQAKKILEPPEVPAVESVDPVVEKSTDVAVPLETASPKEEPKVENTTQKQSDNVDPDVPMAEASESASEQLEKEKEKQIKETRARQLLEAMGVAQ